jgi:hypothetical protein
MKIFFIIIVLLHTCITLFSQVSNYKPGKNEIAIVDSLINYQINNEKIKNSNQSIEEYKEERDYFFNDVNKDGIKDLIIQYTLEKGNNWNIYLAVIIGKEYKDNCYILIARKGFRSATIKEIDDSGKIIIELLYYSETDALCCPSIKGMTKYSYVNKNLNEIDAPRIICK